MNFFLIITRLKTVQQWQGDASATSRIQISRQYFCLLIWFLNLWIPIKLDYVIIVLHMLVICYLLFLEIAPFKFCIANISKDNCMHKTYDSTKFPFYFTRSVQYLNKTLLFVRILFSHPDNEGKHCYLH